MTAQTGSRRPSLEVVPDVTAIMGQVKDPLRSAAASLIKELIWRFCVRFEARKRPICLYASRRSGSTLLMEMIGVNRGVMFSDQPFSVYAASSANINRLPLFPYGQVACPDAQEELLLRAYVQGLLSGRIRANVPWKFWSREFHFTNDRICLKITDAKAIADWIDREFDVQTIVLTRHPIAQALSVARNRWLTTGKGFLMNQRFVRQWLNDDLVAYCWQVYGQGSELEQRVADWALENLPLLAMLRQRPDWLYVSYEDLIQHPSATVDCLATELQLADRQGMLDRMKRPSRSSRRDSSRKALADLYDPDAWQQQVDQQQLQQCFRILERLGIDLYHDGTSSPAYRKVGRNGIQ
jgi:hypothetical protein